MGLRRFVLEYGPSKFVQTQVSFWRSSRDREVDFLADVRPNQVAVEVKYQNRVSARDTLTIRNAFSRGIVLPRQDLDLSGPVRILPAAVFLALLRH